MKPENPARLQATVEGRVQGVGFRYFVYDEAQARGISGWVRNRWDGSVEVMAEGERENLGRLLTALQRGPRAAFVASVQEAWLEYRGEFREFTIRPTD